ncbi:uncharacterized protein TNCV_267981 [Trichonephila clavipes]|nr:uncharacterized protein TNCV_267981 [Trichonephila clavipes]
MYRDRELIVGIEKDWYWARTCDKASHSPIPIPLGYRGHEEFVDDALIYAKSLCEELEISFEPPRRIRKKHIFADGSKDVQLLYEYNLRRTMFSSIDRVTAEIRERFQQLQNLAQKYVFLRPEVILSINEFNLNQAPQDINKEFQLERVRLQAFLAATDPGCKKRTR